jgi:hypothetical protein
MTVQTVDRDTLLDLIGSFADQQDRSVHVADQGSMATAEALEALYRDGGWVGEWLEQHPIKEGRAYIGGRPPQADSRNRFSQWLVWTMRERGQHPLQSRHTYQLLNALEVRSSLRQAQITSERTLRPLGWLRKQHYLDRAEEVWKLAVELAGGDPADVTSAHTREAINAWKRDVLGVAAVKEAIATSKAKRDKAKARTAVVVLYEDGDPAAIAEFELWYADYQAGRVKW